MLAIKCWVHHYFGVFLFVCFCYYYFHIMKYLALKAGQLRQAHTGHVFRGVRWGNVNNMKIMSRSISSHLGLANPHFCQIQLYSQEPPSSVLANSNNNVANRLCTAKSVSKGELGTSAIQHAKIKRASCLLSLHFMDSIK